MKDFGKVSSRFWISDDIVYCSNEAKLMALYLLTTGHGNLIGIFRLPIGYIAADLKWDTGIVRAALDELTSNSFLTHSEHSDYLCIRRFMEHNPTTNSKQVDARLNALTLLPGTLPELLPEAVDVVMATLDKLSSGKVSREGRKHIELIRQKFDRSSEEVRLENKRNRELENKRKEYVRSDDRTPSLPTSSASKATKKTDDLTDDFEQWWQTFPKREGDKGHKQRSYRKYRKLIREQGFTPAQLLANLQAYANYCDQTDATGTQYVKTTEPYLNNPDNLTNPWTVVH